MYKYFLFKTFPDDYHLSTISQLMNLYGQLHTTIDYNLILEPLLRRIITYCNETNSTDFDMVNIFNQINTGIVKFVEVLLLLLCQSRPKMKPCDILHIQYSLLLFITKAVSKEISYVDNIYSYSIEALERSGKQKVTPEAEKEIISLLSNPMKIFNINILNLESFNTVYLFNYS